MANLRRFEMYSDESGNHASEIMGLAAISGTPEALDSLRSALAAVLAANGVSEAKFAETKTHTPKVRAAAQFLALAAEHADGVRIRVDVLSWSHLDSRHQVHGRDDVENLHRMHYHLLSQVLRRFGDDTVWSIFPDEKSEMAWHRVAEVLGNTRFMRKARMRQEAGQMQLYLPNSMEDLRREFATLSVAEIAERQSNAEPLVQLADLFAGFACYSRQKAHDIRKWLSWEESRKARDGDLFSEEALDGEEDCTPVRKDAARFAILRDFTAACRERKRGVSIRTHGYLDSPGGAQRCPICFWHWTPQGPHDKAPIRPSAIGADASRP